MIAGLNFAYGVFVLFTTVQRPPTALAAHLALPRDLFARHAQRRAQGPHPGERLAVTGVAWWLGVFESPVGRGGLWVVALSLGLPTLLARTIRAERSLRGPGATAASPDSARERLTGWTRRPPEELGVVGTFHPAEAVTVDFYGRTDAGRAGAHRRVCPRRLVDRGDPHSQSGP